MTGATRVGRSVPYTLLVLLCAFVGAAIGHENHADLGTIALATAKLGPLAGSGVSGVVTFRTVEKGVEVTIEAIGLSPGAHGFHVHEWGDCSAPDGSSAGEHFNPDGTEHGAPTGAHCHAGDFGNLVADASGHGVVRFVTHQISLGGGANCVLGRSVILHEREDDTVTAKTGNSGKRIACAVIEARGVDSPPVLRPRK